MTPLRKITIAIIILLIISIVLFVMGNYYVASVFVLLDVYLCYKWYFLLTEEMIIYQMLKSNKRIEYQKLINLFGSKARKVVAKLQKRGAVEKIDDLLILKVDDYNFSMIKSKTNKKWH